MSVETAARLCEGGVMPDFTFDTPFAAGLSLSEAVQKTPKTALLFLRYYGCTLCQYEMHLLAENYGQITAAGGQVLVVLQSDPAGIAEQIEPDSLPFTIICDPQAVLYGKFGIQPAASMAKMAERCSRSQRQLPPGTSTVPTRATNCSCPPPLWWTKNAASPMRTTERAPEIPRMSVRWRNC